MASVRMAPRTAPSTERAQEPTVDLAGLGKDERLSVLTQEPLNVETPLELLDGPITPVERLFMRNHHDLINADPRTWRLTLEGLVGRPVTLDFDELLALPRSTYVAVMECSGNGRTAFAEMGQAAEGLPWGQGAVACAEWTGVPVALVLERAGVKATALQAECISAGPEPFVRGIEVIKLFEDSMLAYAVNGRPLDAAHGGPVRLVVPGWGGVNWVKWIRTMRLISHESRSEQNQDHYVLYDDAGRVTGKVRELLVKSIITTPRAGELGSGLVDVRGWAWSAGRGVARVEISVDGGEHWQDAELGNDMGPRAWRGFSWLWKALPGHYTLLARATDRAGTTQPLSVPYNIRGYLNNAVHRVPVVVGE